MAGNTSTPQGYVNGSDLLLGIGGKAVGHCTTHTTTFNSDTKDRAVKPEASKGLQAGLWKAKGVTGLGISISAEGLRFYNETENGYEECAAMWGKGQSVEVLGFKRSDSAANNGTPSAPYLKGKFVITSIEETAAAQDDATYTINLENDGEPDVYPGKVDSTAGNAASEEG